MIWWTMAWTSGPLFFSSEAKRATIRRFLRVSSLLMSRTTLESNGLPGLRFSMVFLTSSVSSESRALTASRNASAAVISGGVLAGAELVVGAKSADCAAASVLVVFLSRVIVGFLSAGAFMAILLFVFVKTTR